MALQGEWSYGYDDGSWSGYSAEWFVFHPEYLGRVVSAAAGIWYTVGEPLAGGAMDSSVTSTPAAAGAHTVQPTSDLD